VLNLKPTPSARGRGEGESDVLSKLDALHKRDRPEQPTLDARIASYELAARMQLAATDALDTTKSEGGAGGVRHRQGADGLLRPPLPDRAALIERGCGSCSFTSTATSGTRTQHRDRTEGRVRPHDRPTAADPRPQGRGLLDSTLVVWARVRPVADRATPADKDERKAGRDHNKNAFCTWMAGGGTKPGLTYGSTDDSAERGGERVSVATGTRRSCTCWLNHDNCSSSNTA